ncbi:MULTISPECIES: DNA polymerase III subunit gamma/tau [unclassified Coleofasciculus]|uniref:DNA polymerase III subunit gamma/tau n=1 Tax=unclassified Coleofasciculus TaxID=2692782 RepID=UPI001880064E|nr:MULTISPECIES: DNA polymerase III subunit gamma/tau [unclassified Coleofasciculus]MBE9130029.1 DNA polymerase III subunit gamma/tau [Coleofasciculus sp. LEGE 07081]MBE9151955.1 DNA polymerase III subunit gamma/tau [Coleofasciculus sp. LEGE 07092]
MSYEPLHHKYRPQTFAHLIGQEAIAQTLTNAIRSERIAPAYLFTGSRGTGKTSSARILAKSLNCLSSEKPTPDPCGVCDVCRTIARGSALDVTEIDAASNTGVDNIREIIERTQFAPVQCRYKVFIIDEVHMLSTAAFNALLKTLEEPPKHVVFVLATTDPQRVLPTIISRCQRFDFRRIPLEAMVKHLQDIGTKESIRITRNAITLVAQVAQGGLRDAESLLDQLSLLAGEITVEYVWDLVGAVPERDLLELVRAIASDNAETVLDQCRRLMDRGREPLIVVQNLAGFYRDLLIAKTAPTRNDLVAVTPPTWDQLREFVQPLEIPYILHGQQHLKNSEAQIKNTTQPRLWLEVTLLGLLPSARSPQIVETSLTSPRTPQSQSSQTSSKTRTSVKNNNSLQDAKPPIPQPTEAQIRTPSPTPITDTSTNGVSPDASQEPKHHQPLTQIPAASQSTVGEAADSNVDIQTTDLEQIWQQVLNHIKLFSTQELLRQQCCLLAFNGQQATLGISSKNLLKLAQEKLPDIEAAFKAIYQSHVRVTLQPKSSESTKTTAAATDTADVSAEAPEELTVNDPKPESRVTELTSSNGHSANTPSSVPVQLIPTREKSPAPIETSNGTSTATLTQSPTSVPTEVANWGAEKIDEVVGNIKKFFDGEIIELTDEFSLSELGVNLPVPLTQPDIDTPINSFSVEAEVDHPKSDGMIAVPQEPQPCRSDDGQNLPTLHSRESLQYNDDGDLAF